MTEEKSKTRTTAKVKLLKKLLEVKKSVAYLQKGKHKGAVQYSYVSSDQVLGACRDKMNELGLLLVPAVSDHTLTPFTTKNGAPQFMTEVDVIMTWIDTDTGEEYPVPYYGQGVDNAEKGIGKAATYLEKYFILKFFNVPTSDLDPDSFQEQNLPTSDLKTKLIGDLKEAKSMKEVTDIWTKNPKLKEDKDFVEAIKQARKRIEPDKKEGK